MDGRRVEVVDRLELLADVERDATEFLVCGRGLGDFAAGLDEASLVDCVPKTPGARFQWSSAAGAEFQIQRQGEPDFVGYPLPERFADAVVHGGTVTIGRSTCAGEVLVTYTLSDAKVSAIRLRGQALAGWGTEPALLREFGSTDVRSRAYGTAHYAWPERGVAAHLHEAGVSIGLGEELPDGVDYGASDLLAAAWAWDQEHPGLTWPLRPHAELDSSRVEAERLTALLRAFGLARSTPRWLRADGWEPANPLAALFDGAFVEAFTPEQLEQVRLRAFALADELGISTERLDPHSFDSFGARWFWQSLMRFGRHAREVTAFNRGVLLAGTGFPALGVELTGHVGLALEGLVTPIVALQAFMLDPTERRISWGQLVRDFGFPDEDLEELRCDEY